jgi:hypothetical protein
LTTKYQRPIHIVNENERNTNFIKLVHVITLIFVNGVIKCANVDMILVSCYVVIPDLDVT